MLSSFKWAPCIVQSKRKIELVLKLCGENKGHVLKLLFAF